MVKVTDDPYRRFAYFYDRMFEPLNRDLQSIGLRMVTVGASTRILDVGCGTGTYLALLRDAGCPLAGIDSSPAMLGMARKRLGDAADLRLADAVSMPYENGSFDLVLCMLALHEMNEETRTAAMREMSRVCSVTGHLLLIDFNAGRPRPIKGWVSKAVILLSERLAGRRHFRNYRHFIAQGGIPPLLRTLGIHLKREKIVGGGTLALYLCENE